MNTAEEKAAQRAEMRAKRDSIEAEARLKHEAALEDRLLNLPALKHAKCIAAYYPCGSEARFVSRLSKLFFLEQTPTVAFPVMQPDDTMSFISFDTKNDLSVLQDPSQIVVDTEESRNVEPERIDLILVPGLAFDKHGNRLGQGMGAYDRFIPSLRDDCLVIGIAFDEQVIDEVVTEPTDAKVGYIVTPTRVMSAEK